MKRPLLLPLVTALIVAGMFAIPHKVAADVVVPTEKPRIDDKRCSIARGRIANIADTMNTVSERRATNYTNIYERSTARATILKQKGYDTSKLESSLKTVEKQIQDYRVKAGELYARLVTTKDMACGDNEGAYNNALAAARTQLKATREASQVINQTLRKDIVAEFKAAAIWIKNK